MTISDHKLTLISAIFFCKRKRTSSGLFFAPFVFVHCKYNTGQNRKKCQKGYNWTTKRLQLGYRILFITYYVHFIYRSNSATISTSPSVCSTGTAAILSPSWTPNSSAYGSFSKIPIYISSLFSTILHQIPSILRSS